MATAPTLGVISPQTPAQVEKEKGGGDSEGRDLILKVLGAVGTGIGILGFVTFFGGAIIWVRANNAGLPANEAVAIVPKGVLVTTGASFLVPALLLALLVLALIGAVHLAWTLSERIGAHELSQKASELRDRADRAICALEPLEQRASSARELATKTSVVLENALNTAGAEGQIAQLRAEAEAKQREALDCEHAARIARLNTEKLNAEAQSEEAAKELALSSKPGLDSPQRIVEYVVTFAVLAVIPVAAYGKLNDVGFFYAIILILVALAAAVISVVTYLNTEKFLWLGVVAFISVGIYTGCATYFRSIKDPKLEPAAALRGDRSPVTGFFIADTAEDLYVGTFAADGTQPHLLVVPRSQVTDLALGSLVDPKLARSRAITLALFECQQSIEEHGKTTTSSPACSGVQEKGLIALQRKS